MMGRRDRKNTFTEDVEAKKGKVIKFGWIEGVYVSINQYLFLAKVVICFNYLDAVSP